jgi:hypothetical protein
LIRGDASSCFLVFFHDLHLNHSNSLKKYLGHVSIHNHKDFSQKIQDSGNFCPHLQQNLSHWKANSNEVPIKLNQRGYEFLGLKLWNCIFICLCSGLKIKHVKVKHSLAFQGCGMQYLACNRWPIIVEHIRV